MDIHIGGELVESLTEAEPDTAGQEAPPTSAEEEPDAGKQPDCGFRVNLTFRWEANEDTVAMVTCSLFSESFSQDFIGGLTRKVFKV